jgi:hypothetical protein
VQGPVQGGHQRLRAARRQVAGPARGLCSGHRGAACRAVDAVCACMCLLVFCSTLWVSVSVAVSASTRCCRLSVSVSVSLWGIIVLCAADSAPPLV